MEGFEISCRAVGLLDVISHIFEDGEYFGALPEGIENVELVTSEAVRIMFLDKVDCSLFCRIAAEDGYLVDAGGYPPRILDKGNIIARVGSRSDPGAERSIFIYLFPSSTGIMSAYMKAVAITHGILNPMTGKISLEKLLRHNLKVIRLVEKYRKNRCRNLTDKLEP